MNTHTGQFIRPTLAEVVTGYTSIGVTKKAAVRFVTGDRLRTGCARPSFSSDAHQIRRMFRRKQAAMFRAVQS